MPVVVPELADTCVVLNGVAKTYAMTGWRVGWMIGPTDVIKAATNLQSHLSSNVCNVAQRAALAAVSGDLTAVAEMRTAFDRRRRSMVDLLSFAMRIILWSLQADRSRNTFILDEPFKFLGSGERLQHAGQMLSEIARSLQVQLIIVTHEEELAELAETAYQVTHDGTESRVIALKLPTAEIKKPTTIKRRAGR